MKVYELMSRLETLPCNMEVSIQGQSNNGEPFPISQFSCEDPTPGSSVWLMFDDFTITYDDDQPEEIHEVTKEVVVELPQEKKRGRPRKNAA